MSSSFSGIFQSNAGYVEEVFARYQTDPNAVSSEWRAYFEGFHEGFGNAVQLIEQGTFPAAQGASAAAIQASSYANGASNGNAALVSTVTGAATGTSLEADIALEFACAALVVAYRAFGHFHAKTDPLGFERPTHPALLLETHGLSHEALTRRTWAGLLCGLKGPLTLHELLRQLEAIYCGTVGMEFDHIASPEERAWLHARAPKLQEAPAAEVKRALFEEFAKADALEKTIGTKFIGKKRFSIEGADAQIPAVESFLEASTRLGAAEFCIGMAHRGRLNTLVHVAGKPLEQLFAEFEGYPSDALPGDWDVKYHSGWESERPTRGGTQVRVSLSFNPSHLEFVDAVTLGETRARQKRYHGGDQRKVVPVLLHGDAAFAGQGVVYETIQMMTLQGYAVGGALHLVANNQVGFTTNPFDSRSSSYCTDVAKVVGAPVFHVNADDVHALHNVMVTAAEYRAAFGKDVVVDLVCFRRHGHNETDEPRFTQPILYKAIELKKAPFEAYMATLASSYAAEGFDEAGLKAVYEGYRASMNAVFDKVRSEHTAIAPMARQRGIASLRTGTESDMLARTGTGVPIDLLKRVGEALVTVPEGFTVNSKLSRIILGERKDMLDGKKRIDWGFGELLAYGTLLAQGTSVRLAGQDARRGTFSHRHGTLVDANSGAFLTPLDTVCEGGAGLEIIDSHLSEMGAMGYDYGYSVQNEKALVLWEAQFGDFSNGAQVIIDQFLAAGESKWGQSSGLVLLLPHGFEGQGPEHSSARLERYLQLCAQGNMQVCYFTNVAQLFHALRRQVVRDFRKPMVVMTPKSFLRSQRATASFEDLATGWFEPVLADPRAPDAGKVKKVVFCAGKVALDLFDALDKEDNAARAAETAVVRVEQLYPFDSAAVVATLRKYGKATEVVWCQEEPANMGAWTFVWPRLLKALGESGLKAPLEYVGRSERASPAVGLEKAHAKEQERIVEHALNGKGTLEV